MNPPPGATQAVSRWRLAALALAFAAVAIVGFFTLRPQFAHGTRSLGLPLAVRKFVDGHDVAANVVGYIPLGVLAWAALGHRSRAWLFVFLVSPVFEVAQAAVPGRIFDWKDLVANAAGVTLGILMLNLPARLLRARRQSQTPPA
jgi:VanZ family protein